MLLYNHINLQDADVIEHFLSHNEFPSPVIKADILLLVITSPKYIYK
jgi:hypothetical protein